ncbi:hypothetical protein BJY16_007045 [Actinoplanes octamycinicus]|uniref:Uncharacterized protein n=1 Tax=Actinoplanes octamycinicus TaxID=135948 RepID=A0A7W7H408_9ACTN|nr:hypothetical protein [Actinoplanes octamycinicus]MBB4743586.1 hypothetical protein [Actinoplanes octamycinicus]GIE61011.1 hypothetical protein Aoc01nite_64130 [Actinoplanes octamycinicus]
MCPVQRRPLLPGRLTEDPFPVRPQRARNNVRLGAYAYAARAVPVGLVAAVLPGAGPGTGVGWLLAVAAVIQAFDVAIGVWRREAGMTIGASSLTVIHTVTAIALW